MLHQLIELVRKKNIFRWNRKKIEIKLIPIILYYAGISLRKTSKFLKDFEKFSHEAVRELYHKLAQLSTSSRRYRRCIAIDETKIRIGDKWWYIWAAIDVETWEILGVMVTIKIDRAPWYRWALKSMNIWRRKSLENGFNILKARLKRFWKRFPSNASKESIEKWLTAFVVIYNLEVQIS